MQPDPIVEAVRAKLLGRSKAGILKYGTSLARTDLSRLDWLKHAQEEAMDLCNYLECLIQIEENAKTVPCVLCGLPRDFLGQGCFREECPPVQWPPETRIDVIGTNGATGEHYGLRDAGPTAYAGRSTKRDRDD